MNSEREISPPTAAANNAAPTTIDADTNDDTENTPPDPPAPTGPGELVYGFIHTLLQFVPRVNPISLMWGLFARFPATLPDPHGFDLSMVKKLCDAGDFDLVPGKHKGIDRYCLKRRGSATYLTPMDDARLVRVNINGKMERFNVAKLIASSILGRDVTGHEWGALIDTDGIWMENDADRDQLNEEMEIQCENQCIRVDLKKITRPGSETIDVTGRGYYTQGGKVYGKNGNVIAMTESGHLFLTGSRGTKRVHIARILFTAYPDLYKFDPEYHDQIDHIDGDHTNNEPWNFRPVTRHQNGMVRVQTGDRMERPSPSSSIEVSKKDHGIPDIMQKTIPADDVDTFMETMGFKRYLDTGYWVHRSSCVLVLVRVNKYVKFKFAGARVNRHGYTYICGRHALHRMVVIAHGGFTKEELKGRVIMHLDDDKQNNAFENLRVGTSSENAHKKSPVEICIDGEDPQTFPSESEAARVTGIPLTAIRNNRKRKHDGTPQSSTTRGSSPITFTAV
jgi:hypothetical protein